MKILNLDPEITQDIEFDQMKNLKYVNKPLSSGHFIVCTQSII